MAMNPDTSHINVIKSAKVLDQYPCSLYQLNVFSGMATIQLRATKEVVIVISPNYYDYLEIEDDAA